MAAAGGDLRLHPLASALRKGVRIEEGMNVSELAPEATEPITTADDRHLQVQVLSTSMTIHDLSIERASIIDYLRTIAPDKQAIALVHALEVGITEMIARRERFKH
jgi:hypothetical protein